LATTADGAAELVAAPLFGFHLFGDRRAIHAARGLIASKPSRIAEANCALKNRHSTSRHVDRRGLHRAVLLALAKDTVVQRADEPPPQRPDLCMASRRRNLFQAKAEGKISNWEY
jgi:hypothetical protein